MVPNGDFFLKMAQPTQVSLPADMENHSQTAANPLPSPGSNDRIPGCPGGFATATFYRLV
ncbi:MAG: hypothetical protein CMJ81_05780 [Planctomycetaceae bacterium]|nr:hypothetical protein [Planctomycetaceae bacterium]MBP61999.1 hypothetical protein [Planctomycetaceae bacterium]